MNPCRGIAASLAFACTALPAAAQPVPPPPRLATLPAAPRSPAAAAPTSSASASMSVGALAGAPAAPASAGAGNVRVIEDDQVRIEETRDARGQLQRVTVKSKVGGKSYEIIVPPGGKDSSQSRGTSGQAAWRLFDF